MSARCALNRVVNVYAVEADTGDVVRSTTVAIGHLDNGSLLIAPGAAEDADVRDVAESHVLAVDILQDDVRRSGYVAAGTRLEECGVHIYVCDAKVVRVRAQRAQRDRIRRLRTQRHAAAQAGTDRVAVAGAAHLGRGVDRLVAVGARSDEGEIAYLRGGVGSLQARARLAVVVGRCRRLADA